VSESEADRIEGVIQEVKTLHHSSKSSSGDPDLQHLGSIPGTETTAGSASSTTGIPDTADPDIADPEADEIIIEYVKS
jgi:hypothetical protein